jgi:cardiolipin synthase
MFGTCLARDLVIKPMRLADESLGFWVRRVFTVPNLLTLVRLPLAALLWLRPHDTRWLLTIIVVGALSDVVDGRIAQLLRRRASNEHLAEDRAVGDWLDPVCDKIFALSVLSVLWLGSHAPLGIIALAATRELILAPLIALYHLFPVVRRTLQFDFRADWLGKLTTVLQASLALAILVVPSAMVPLAIATAAMGLWAAVHYVRRGIMSARAAARDQFRHR